MCAWLERREQWVVADLDDVYIAKMEDVLEVYERPCDPQQPVICVDEKPVTLHDSSSRFSPFIIAVDLAQKLGNAEVPGPSSR